MPKLILSAGMYRSGSTWLFNAIRLMYEPEELYCAGEGWYDATNKKPVHLIKIHGYDHELVMKSPHIFTIIRPDEEIKASMIRSQKYVTKGFEGKGRVDMFDKFKRDYIKYKEHSDFNANFPSSKLIQLENVVSIALKMNLRLYNKRFVEILKELENMKPPKEGWDPVTFLHANHFTSR